MARMPYEVSEAIVETCGRAFWLKDPLFALLRTAGVSPALIARYRDESKYKIARHILDELDAQGESGVLVQRRILTELCKLRNVPDPTVPDRDAALNSLRRLKELAVAQRVLVLEEVQVAQARKLSHVKAVEAQVVRTKKLEELRVAFHKMATSAGDPQARGYGLEELLKDLFEVHEIAYRPPYRAGNEQIDGHFVFEGLHYLVEARWRNHPPTESDLSAFKRKVDKKIASTRGLFVSVIGFRQEVIEEFAKGATTNLILVDGPDLVEILEGRISLTDALGLKVQKASQEGRVFYPLSARYDA